MSEETGTNAKCNRCGRTNPEAFAFCPACGQQMAERGHSELEEDRVLSKLQAYLEKRLKGAKAVEIEIAEAAATRISSWVKLFGVFAGIPAALLVATLALLGVTSFVQLQDKEKAATKQVDDVAAQASKLRNQLGEYALFQSQLSNLAKRVNRLEDFTLANPTGIPKATWDEFLSHLQGFEDHLQDLGYVSSGTRTFSIRVVDSPGRIFRLGEAAIEIDRTYITSTDVLLEAYFAHVLRSQAEGIPAQPDIRGDRLPWALGVYFVCSFNNSPQFRYTQSGALDLSKDEQRHVGEPLAHAFWTMRQTVGPDAADRLLFASLTNVQTKSGNDVAAFESEVEREDAKLFDGSHDTAIRGAFKGVIIN
jgi:hypothetical protein